MRVAVGAPFQLPLSALVQEMLSDVVVLGTMLTSEGGREGFSALVESELSGEFAESPTNICMYLSPTVKRELSY